MGDDLSDSLAYTTIEELCNVVDIINDETISYSPSPIYPHYITIDAQPELTSGQVVLHRDYVGKLLEKDFPELSKLHKKAMEKEQIKKDFKTLTAMLEKSISNVETIRF